MLFITSFLQASDKKDLLIHFRPFHSASNRLLETRIKQKLEGILKDYNIQFRNEALGVETKDTEENQNYLIIDISYKTNESFPPDIYAQIYHPKNKEIIDAISQEIDFELIEGIELKPEEFEEEERLEEFAKRLEVSLKVNPKREKLTYNIIEHYLNRPVSSGKKEKLIDVDRNKEKKEAYRLLEENQVITASRRQQAIEESPAKVIVIDAKTIEERAYRTLTEVLQDVNGFDFSTFYDSGEYTTDVILRGIGDVGQTQILIMEDGIIQNDIGNGWMRHMQYDISLIDVKRIEIILGPGSALYGANAYAGLINIITKRSKDIYKENSSSKIFSETHIDYGSFQTKLIESFFSYRFSNGLNLRLAGRYMETPGDGGKGRPDPGNYFNNNYEPDKVQINDYGKFGGSEPSVENDRYPGGVRKKIKDGFKTDKENVFIRGAIQKEEFNFGFTIWDLTEGLGSYVPSYEYFTNTDDIPYTKRHNGYFFHIDYGFNVGRKFSSLIKLYTRNTNIHPDTGFVYTYRYQSVETPVINGVQYPPVPDKVKEYHAQSYLSGYQEQFNYDLSNSNHLIWGMQLERVIRAASGDELGGISLGKRQNLRSTIVEKSWDSRGLKSSVAAMFYSTNAAFYIQDEQKFYDNQYGITIGIRRDYDTDYGYVWTARSGLVGNPIKNIYFKLLYGEAFKAPTVFQLYDEFRGNEFLKPQKIKTYETELSYKPFTNITFKGGYFFSQLIGQINEAPNPNDGTYLIGSESQKASYYQNLANTHIYGTSFELDWKPYRYLSFFTNYTYTGKRKREGLFEVDVDPLSGKINNIRTLNDGYEIDNIAARKANIGIYYILLGKVSMNLRMNWVGKRKAPSTNRYFQPYDYSFTKYPYVTEGKPDSYLASYTLVNLTLAYHNLFGIQGLISKLIIRNLFNKEYMGVGRQAGSATRPIDELQPMVSNPEGFVSPYHPQPRREVYLRLSYRL